MWAVHHESPILTLRIDHQRPSSRTVHNDSIINGKRIHRKSGDLPVTHFDRFSECWVQWEVLWAWNLDFLTQVDPLRDTILLRKMKWSWVLIINTWWYSHTIKSLYLSLPLIFSEISLSYLQERERNSINVNGRSSLIICNIWNHLTRVRNIQNSFVYLCLTKTL